METETINSAISSVKYKLVLLGDCRVGKTSILTQFILGEFDELYTATVGIDFLGKTLPLDDRNVCLQLWDTSGLGRFRCLIPMYIRDSSAVIIVFDVTNRQSFISVSDYIKGAKNHLETGVIMVLVGNKVDKAEERCVTLEEAAAKAKKLGVIDIEASAKTGDNIKPLFTIIAWILAAGNSHTSRRKINDIKLRPSASIQLQVSRTSKKNVNAS